ncbi:hypothetical protein BB8028_0005g03260 [Beauveria bassiana]|uniref:Uncharacterized protein n=1 Tax=Beauveria bassiana TaxID=176275 RepID=A0A2S7YFU6_BEABA|nr:hypothetical protein BB8028_0005g03260 [Beauveria bassiana]
MAPFLPPSRTVPLQPRQASTATTTVTVTSNPNNGNGGGSTLDGGAIAGIVIGSIVGFLLLVWIIRSCFNLGGPSPTPEVEPWYGRHSEPKHYHRHHHRRPRSRRPRSRSSSITLQPPPVVVRQERSGGRRSSRSRSVYNTY